MSEVEGSGCFTGDCVRQPRAAAAPPRSVPLLMLTPREALPPSAPQRWGSSSQTLF